MERQPYSSRTCTRVQQRFVKSLRGKEIHLNGGVLENTVEHLVRCLQVQVGQQEAGRRGFLAAGEWKVT